LTKLCIWAEGQEIETAHNVSSKIFIFEEMYGAFSFDDGGLVVHYFNSL
jgi:hypothetical protein